MTAHAPLPYGRDADGRLLIAGRTADRWAEVAGDTPLFLYDAARMTARVTAFRAAMPADLLLHYAVKANPFPPLVARLGTLVDGFDVASAGELCLALEAGMPAGRIGFAGPAKRDRELAAAIEAGAVLSIESAGELDRVEAAALRLRRTARAMLRINPPFQLRGSGMRMGGLASPFGVDSADAPALVGRLRAPPFAFEGLHIYAGSQNLDADAILDAQQRTLALAAELATVASTRIPALNLGGGFGVPYFPGDRPLDLAVLGGGLADLLAARPPALGDTRFILELGRWLVADAGVYLCRIVDRKQSGGQTFLVTDGGLHHQLAASGNFGTVVRRNYPVANASRDRGEPENASVVGCLCTPLDRLAERITLPRSEVGDLIAVFLAGAYGRTASPERFLGHPPAAEILAEASTPP